MCHRPPAVQHVSLSNGPRPVCRSRNLVAAVWIPLLSVAVALALPAESVSAEPSGPSRVESGATAAGMDLQAEPRHGTHPANPGHVTAVPDRPHSHAPHEDCDGEEEGHGPTPTAAPAQQPPAANRFNPAIALVLDGRYYRDSVHGEGGHLLDHVKGFHGHHHDHGHGPAHGEVEPGFNLAGAELMVSASADSYFDALLTLVFDGHSVELEEAYGVTRGLPAGFTLKFGQFFSGIGIINSRHPHAWDFADHVLPHHLIFGPHGLNDVGVQLTWTAPGRNILLLGVEVLQGENEGVANSIGHVDHDVAVGVLSEKAGPRLRTGFARFSPVLPGGHTVRVGGFAGQSSLHQEMHEHGHGRNYLEGTSSFWGADIAYSFHGHRAGGQGDLSVQGEYLRRVKDLHMAVREFPGALRASEWTQDGAYLQAVYGVAPRFTAGLRWEAVGLTNRRVIDDAPESWGSSSRVTGALTFNPSGSSRVRLQWGRSSLLTDAGRERFNQVTVQYQLTLGTIPAAHLQGGCGGH